MRKGLEPDARLGSLEVQAFIIAERYILQL